MHDVPSEVAVHHLTAPTGFIRKWVFSLDHKVIGKQYYALALVSVFIGMVLSWFMRIHLAWPNWPIPLLDKLSAVGAPAGVMTPEYYLSLLTMHGTIMVFFVLTNAPFAAFGNYFLPIQIGAEDMAFPRFNMMSFWTTFVAWLFMMAAFFVADGPPISGWTAYAPLSAVGGDAGPGLAMGQDLWAISIAVFCIASLLGALNFISTTLDLRTKGMSLARMPFCSWAWFVTSIIALLAFAVLLPACILLILDRVAGTSFFIPAGLVLERQAAAPLRRFAAALAASVLVLRPSGSLYRHSSLDRNRGHHSSGLCAQAAAGTSRRSRQHDRHRLPQLHGLGPPHVRQRHESLLGGSVFSSDADHHHPGNHPDLVADRNGVRRENAVHSAALFCLGFISVFISGGISGFFLAQPSLDTVLHATYFVVAHFHFVMAVASIFGVFAGTYYWFPKMTGRMMNEALGKWHFWLTFIGVYAIFMPMHYLGLAGNIRRYSAFVDDFMIPLIPVHKAITIAALLTGAAQLIFLYNLIHSRFRGAIASENPWEATSLEWSTSSPPPFDNFGGRHLVVNHGPNEYGIDGPQDYIMQASPEQAPPR